MLLEQIVQNSRLELETRKIAVPLAKIKELAFAQTPALDMAAAISGQRVRLIAEVKKASPSKGLLRQDFNPLEIASTYAQNGAAAISVLTDSKYFQGSLTNLHLIKTGLGSQSPPLLRKDFILDPYQIFEARAYGADAVLLIVAILDQEQLGELLKLSRQLKMACLVEVHNQKEIQIATRCKASIIGINNRDLKTFKVDITTTANLRPLISGDIIVVSESGIRTRRDMDKLQEWGVNAALVGESLVSSPDIAQKMQELI